MMALRHYYFLILTFNNNKNKQTIKQDVMLAFQQYLIRSLIAHDETFEPL